MLQSSASNLSNPSLQSAKLTDYSHRLSLLHNSLMDTITHMNRILSSFSSLLAQHPLTGSSSSIHFALSQVVQDMDNTIQLNQAILSQVYKYIHSILPQTPSNSIHLLHYPTFLPHSNTLRGPDGLTFYLTCWQLEPYINWTLLRSLEAMLLIQHRK